MYMFIYRYVCLCLHMYIYLYVCVYVYMYVNVYTYMCVCFCTTDSMLSMMCEMAVFVTGLLLFPPFFYEFLVIVYIVEYFNVCLIYCLKSYCFFDLFVCLLTF